MGSTAAVKQMYLSFAELYAFVLPELELSTRNKKEVTAGCICAEASALYGVFSACSDYKMH